MHSFGYTFQGTLAVFFISIKTCRQLLFQVLSDFFFSLPCLYPSFFFKRFFTFKNKWKFDDARSPPIPFPEHCCHEFSSRLRYFELLLFLEWERLHLLFGLGYSMNWPNPDLTLWKFYLLLSLNKHFEEGRMDIDEEVKNEVTTEYLEKRNW